MILPNLSNNGKYDPLCGQEHLEVVYAVYPILESKRLDLCNNHHHHLCYSAQSSWVKASHSYRGLL